MAALLHSITAGDAGTRRVALPEPTYDSVFEFIRNQARGYIADVSAIEPGDALVRRDRFGRDDVSYFGAELEQILDLDIPDSENRKVLTFHDLARLLTRHLEQKRKSEE